MRVLLSPQAQTDLRSQIDWLTERSPQAAEKATRRIFNALSLLSDFPRAGYAIEGKQREKPVKFGQFGFVIRYELHSDKVIVTAIQHGRQAR